MSTLLYRVKVNIYSDEYVTLKSSTDHVFCIPTADSLPAEEVKTDDVGYNYFSSSFENPNSFLRAGWLYQDRDPVFNGEPCNLYLPNAQPFFIEDTDYIEMVFVTSGCKIRRIQQWSGAGSPEYLLIKQDGTSTGSAIPNIFGHEVNRFYATQAPVILEMSGDTVTSLGVLTISARYFSPFAWYQTLSGSTWTDQAFINFINNDLVPDARTDDPYAQGGTSTTRQGGTGTFDNSSTPVDFPSLPSISATDAGFMTIFNPTLAQLQALSAYMWSSAFDVDAFKKIFADPADVIMGLSIVPVSVASTTYKTIIIGTVSTGIQMSVASSQYIEVDCGSLNVEEYWGAYLDYSPYTKVEIYLPYIGTRPLSTDDVMGKSVQVKYHVDVLSGACIAYIKCGSSVLYSFTGQCATVLPITGNDWTSAITGALSIAGAIGTTIASGGAAAPMLAGVASTAVNSLKPEIQKSGCVSGSGGLMAIQTPYLIITRPRQAIPDMQNHYIGYPAFATLQMADLYGYTEIESVHLEGIPCTQAELDEILTLLKGGVLF